MISSTAPHKRALLYMSILQMEMRRFPEDKACGCAFHIAAGAELSIVC